MHSRSFLSYLCRQESTCKTNSRASLRWLPYVQMNLCIMFDNDISTICINFKVKIFTKRHLFCILFKAKTYEKMKVFNVCLSFIALILLSCGTSKVTLEQINALDQLVKNQKFSIESDWAYPMTTTAVQQVLNSGLLPPGNSAGRINLISNANVLTISGDSISSYLPYFGERQMNVEYGGRDAAIQFDGLMEDYKIKSLKNHDYQITFKAKSKSETFDVFITITPSLKSNIILNSATRRSIRYTGSAKTLEK